MTALLQTIAGSCPLVLLAPHGGRRDPERRPWTSGGLKVNDLHTPALTLALAARLRAFALVNADLDRNDVDLNRIAAAAEGAPEFLFQLAEVLRAALAYGERVTLLVVHGWNVIQPAVDLGLGCSPAADPFVVDGHAAVSPAFAASGVRALVEACAARGIAASVGARYPARHRQNLLQLFTPRYADDPRPAVQAPAALADQVDAVQLELGIPLRWAGPWQERFLDACSAALPALVPERATVASGAAPSHRTVSSGNPAALAVRRLEFTDRNLCGLVGVDPGTGRLLLFPPEGGLVLFTGESLGRGAIDGLTVEAAAYGVRHLCFDGPLLHFPDTTPFLDLERGLAGARLLEGHVHLTFTPERAPGATGTFGRVEGQATFDGVAHPIAGHGFSDDRLPQTVGPRLRAALRLADGGCLALTLLLPDRVVEGVLYRGERGTAVIRAAALVGPDERPLERLALDVECADGERLSLVVRARHQLPVIRAHRPAPIRLEFAACSLDPAPDPTGWCEVLGL